jgi:adenylate cyclase
VSLFHELKRRNVIRVATGYIVAAWLIIQVVETLFPIFELPANAIRVVVIALGIGFVPAIIVAWVFQITPDGVKLDKDAIAGEVTTSGRNLDRAIIITLLLGISFFAFDKFVLAPDRAAEREAVVAEAARSEAIVGFYGDRSIAVIPFDNMSSDPEQEYFVDGIAEEVLNLLAKIRELRVISRSSSFAFKGENLEIPEIAERLDVAHILEGSVRKIGNTVRVTAQLIEARSDTHLWSETYERELEDVFAIQDEIAADVAKNLKIELLRPLPRSRRTDPAVRALTQQAKQIAEIRPFDAGAQMYPLLERALEIDPNYVPALEWMASANFFREDEGLISNEERLLRWEETSQRILKLDPDNTAVMTVLAFRASGRGELEEAAALHAIALSKDATDSNMVRLAGSFARYIGKMETAERLLRHAVAIDPLCFRCLYLLSRTQLFSGDLAEAEKSRERFLALGNGGEFHYGLMRLLQGDAVGALAQYQTFEADSAQGPAGRALAYFDLGDQEQTEVELEKLQAMETSEVDELIAQVAAYSGNSELAFEKLELLATNVQNGARSLVFNPLMKNLHSDPRWGVWRASIGMSEERLNAIEFNPDLPE